MPLVKISILDNWTHEEKENLHNAVHTALKTAFILNCLEFDISCH